MIIVSRIIHVKVDRRLNVTNKFKYQRRLSSRLAIVMFRGTPCTNTKIMELRASQILQTVDSHFYKITCHNWQLSSSHYSHPHPSPALINILIGLKETLSWNLGSLRKLGLNPQFFFITTGNSNDRKWRRWGQKSWVLVSDSLFPLS